MKLFRLCIYGFFICFLITGCNKHTGYRTTDGGLLTDSDLKGRWVFVNYWADWCKPCMTELPEFDRFYVKNHETVMVIGVSFDTKTAADIQAFAESLDLRFPMLTSFPLAQYGLKSPSSLPMTLVINPKGELVKVLYGPQTVDTLTQFIKPL